MRKTETFRVNGRMLAGMGFRSVLVFLLISCVAVSEAQEARAPASDQIVYRNSAYGFCFDLPASWSGYSIVTEQWQGEWIGDHSQAPSAKELAGPKIIIRHPKWTKTSQREDIPIMVFSRAQWKLVAAEEISVGAAPIGPTELGRNTKYVFALPARYEFDEKEGVEEVVELMQHHPLQAPCSR
jgi:hypothetical protein